MKIKDFRKEKSDNLEKSPIKSAINKLTKGFKTFKTKMDFAVGQVKRTFQSNLEQEMKKRGLSRTHKSLDEQFKERYEHQIYRNHDRENPVIETRDKTLNHVRKDAAKELVKQEEVSRVEKRTVSTGKRKRFGDVETPEERLQREEKERKNMQEEQERIARGEQPMYRTIDTSEAAVEKRLRVRAEIFGFDDVEEFQTWRAAEVKREREEREREEFLKLWRD